MMLLHEIFPSPNRWTTGKPTAHLTRLLRWIVKWDCWDYTPPLKIRAQTSGRLHPPIPTTLLSHTTVCRWRLHLRLLHLLRLRLLKCLHLLHLRLHPWISTKATHNAAADTLQAHTSLI